MFLYSCCPKFTGLAGGDPEARAFVFERGGKPWVIYWNTRGNKRLELALAPSDIALCRTIGQSETVPAGDNGGIVVPLGERRYIEAKNLTKQQLLDALKNARIVE